jgi:hypothetical protein
MRAIVSACFTALFAVAARAAPFEPVDLATPYVSFWDDTRSLATAERVAAFKARFETLLPGFFRAERVGWMTTEQYDDAIVQSFEKFPALRDRFVATTSNLTRSLAPAYARFAHAFPDLKPIGPIYLMHSLGEFDGGTKPVHGTPRLVFGIDVITQLHGANLQPFFQHELFHVYHSQFFTECEQMWCALWSEGLAVFVAQQLNRQATDAELLLDSPKPIRPEVERDRHAAACAVAARLESTEGADYAAMFSSGPSLAHLPPRGGYFVGYLVAQEAARKRSVAQLAHLDNAAAHELVITTLSRLARCAKPAVESPASIDIPHSGQ